jgi:hypothetical protein
VVANKGNAASLGASSSLGEGEEASEEPAHDCDEEKIDSIALSLAKYIMRSMVTEENNAQLDDDEAMIRELLKLELERTGERKVEEEEPEEEEDTEMERSDYEAWVASQYREEWTSRYSASYGSFDDTSKFSTSHSNLHRD